MVLGVSLLWSASYLPNCVCIKRRNITWSWANHSPVYDFSCCNIWCTWLQKEHRWIHNNILSAGNLLLDCKDNCKARNVIHCDEEVVLGECNFVLTFYFRRVSSRNLRTCGYRRSTKCTFVVDNQSTLIKLNDIFQNWISENWYFSRPGQLIVNSSPL